MVGGELGAISYSPSNLNRKAVGRSLVSWFSLVLAPCCYLSPFNRFPGGLRAGQGRSGLPRMLKIVDVKCHHPCKLD